MSKKTGGPTFCIATLGCKVNKSDTDNLQRILYGAGFREVPFEAGADLYLINTCTVTAKSDFHSRQLARRALKQNRRAKVVVTGCYAQTNPQALAALPEVTLVLGNREQGKLLDYLKPHIPLDSPPIARPAPRDADYTRAFLKIQDGCNWACAYCIVPRARGKSRSVPPQELVSQAKKLIGAGYREIVLTGIHIGLYGLDSSPPSGLITLLQRLCSLEGLGRLRLSSLEPSEFSDDLIGLIKSTDKICRHFHIPLQSADDRILRDMDRNYRYGEYRELLHKLRAALPDAALGCDVIVGFPGEEQDSFSLTRNRLEELPLTYLHVFSYSKRPGTRASQMPGQVAAQEKKARSNELRRLSARKKALFYIGQKGAVKRCLVLKQDVPEKGLLAGLSDNYINILLRGGPELINNFVDLRITEVGEEGVFGEITGPAIRERGNP